MGHYPRIAIFRGYQILEDTRVLECVTLDAIGVNIENKITQSIWTEIWIINIWKTIKL